MLDLHLFASFGTHWWLLAHLIQLLFAGNPLLCLLWLVVTLLPTLLKYLYKLPHLLVFFLHIFFNNNNILKCNPQDSCTIEFDGASRGNPGRAGAGAVLRAPDNTVLFRSREGLGSATNNVAEYRALNLGLETALNNGFRNVRVQGDSQLVCKQVQVRLFSSYVCSTTRLCF